MKATLITLAAVALAAAGCQQKMADQPYHRPYETSDVFPNQQSARPIERGTVHAGQLIDGDPLATWLTEYGRTRHKPFAKPEKGQDSDADFAQRTLEWRLQFAAAPVKAEGESDAGFKRRTDAWNAMLAPKPTKKKDESEADFTKREAAWREAVTPTDPKKADGESDTDFDIRVKQAKQADSLAAELKDVTTDLGAPISTRSFVAVLPFPMDEADYKRGANLFRAVCAECHGAAGHGNGRIPERGFLRPPSYHRDPKHPTENDVPNPDKPYAMAVVGKLDWSTMKAGPDGRVVPSYTNHPQGFSRGFSRLGNRVGLEKTKNDKGETTERYAYLNRIALDQVPVGYIYQVITVGFGGMASHATQIPDPADRWRVVAYIRALQLSQLADETALPADVKEAIKHPPVKTTDAKKGDH